MTRSRAITLSALVLLLLVSGIFSERLRQGQALRVEPVAGSPVELQPEPEPGKKGPAGSYRMKCEEVRSFFTHHPSQGQTEFDTDPCGWKEVADGNGNRVWYRLFLQTTVVTNVEPGGAEVGSATVTFTARGRHAAVICKWPGGSVSPPPDTAVGNGYGSWSEWRESKRSTLVTCDARSGNISSRPGHGDEEKKRFSDGLSLELQTPEAQSERETWVFGRATATHPLGGDGDGERGGARFSAFRQP